MAILGTQLKNGVIIIFNDYNFSANISRNQIASQNIMKIEEFSFDKTIPPKALQIQALGASFLSLECISSTNLNYCSNKYYIKNQRNGSPNIENGTPV